MIRAALHRRTAAGVALVLALGGALAVVTTTSAADAAPADLVPPASGILPGPAAGGDDPGSWGPCVPDPGATDSCQGWLVPPGAIVAQFPGTDDAPSIVVGGDFTADLGSAETEGLLVVDGDADFLKSYNVGVAGGGTGVVPAHRANMLVVGGDATVANPSLDPNVGGHPANVGVGLTTTDGTNRYGAIHVGGAHDFRDPSFGAPDTTFGILGNIDTANQTTPAGTQNVLDSDTSVLADDHYTDLFGANGKMTRYSQQCYAELSTDTAATTVRNEGGTLSLEHGTVDESAAAGVDIYTLTSTGSGDVVEFQLPASVGTSGQDAQIHVVGVKEGATVIINSLADGVVNQFVGDVYWGTGSTDDLKTAALTHGTHILWNYPFATSLTLGGATQFPGSILVGETTSTTRIGFSGSNGRIYTAGNLVHSGAATSTSGDELHAYPFTGALGCIQAVPGTFTVQKAINGNGASQVPGGTTFGVHWAVTGPTDSPDLGREGELQVGADGTPVTGPDDLQEGDVVTLSETAPPDVDGIDWGTPTVSPNPITVGTDDTVQAVTVTNTATVQRGGFTITKALADGSEPGASTTTFDVDWQCSAENTAGDDSGTVRLAAGTSQTVTGFPVGTTCTFSEDTPADDAGTWATPSVDPDSVTVAQGDGTAQVVTVTNSFTHAVGGFTITKTVTGDAGASTTSFTGAWTCDAPDADGDSSGTWSLGNGGSDAHEGFPTGTTCSVTEDRPTDDNGTWTSTIDPAGGFAITEGTASARVVTVTNAFTSEIGAFEIHKLVAGDPGSSVAEFTVDWSCDQPNADGESSGTVTVHADETSDPVGGFPVGTTCTISEPTVDDPAGTWTSTVTPATLTIGSTDPSQSAVVTVTNTFDSTTPTPTPTPTHSTPVPTTPAPTSPAPTSSTAAPGPTAGPTTPSAGGGGLAVTGFDALTIAAVGAFLLALGLAAVLIARRRRS